MKDDSDPPAPAADCAAGIYASAKRNAAAVARRTDEAVRAKPYQALFLAAGVGLLIGLWVGRRKK